MLQLSELLRGAEQSSKKKENTSTWTGLVTGGNIWTTRSRSSFRNAAPNVLTSVSRGAAQTSAKAVLQTYSLTQKLQTTEFAATAAAAAAELRGKNMLSAHSDCTALLCAAP